LVRVAALLLFCLAHTTIADGTLQPVSQFPRDSSLGEA
jgi:hypothetical protein